MRRRKFKRLSTYKKGLVIYTNILIILSIVALLYVYDLMKLYENADTDNYINSLVKSIKYAGSNNNIEKYFDIKDYENNYEKNPDIKKGYKDLLSNAEMSYKKVDINTYDLFADSKKIATVVLDDSKKITRLKLLTFADYQITDLKTYDEKGLYNVDIYLLDNFDLYINNKKVEEKDLLGKEGINQYKEVQGKVELPEVNHYLITNLTNKPKVEVKDGSKNVKIVEKDGKYYANQFYKTNNKEEAFAKLTNKTFDPLEFAKKWSLFLSKDLYGVRYGLYELTPNLLMGTEMYSRAVNWATNVDITFTSSHTLDANPFTNIKVSNYTIYNENAFSVDVYLEKNMTLKTGEKRKDILNDTFY